MPFIIPGGVDLPQLAPVLLERLAPWLTPATDPYGDHAKYLTAVAAMGQELYGLVTDVGDDPDDPAWVSGWSVLFDVDKCPTKYLPYLAQLVGVQIPAGTSDADSRQIIRAEQAQARGTPASIVSTAQRYLSVTKSAVIEERTAADASADPYHFLLIVRPEEIVDVNQLTAAVNAVKPAGLQWTLIQSDAPLLNQYTRLFPAITVQLGSATLADVI